MSTVSWTEHATVRSAHWHSENETPAPARIVAVDDHLTADAALRLARSGHGLLWRGDFPTARQLVQAMKRRLERQTGRTAAGGISFPAYRQLRSVQARLLGRVLIPVEPGYSVALRRAPDVRAACRHAYGPAVTPTGDFSGGTTLVALTELLGVISAYEWHRRGIRVSALGARLHPAYGVFAPTRAEYVDLVAEAPLPGGAGGPVVFDIGTGTGVLAALLAGRGAAQVVATDLNPRAVRCAAQNIRRLGLAGRVRVAEADLWPAGQADLVVCNPPWLPGTPTSALELGIYDRESDMLSRFLAGLADRLTPRGEGWLVLSDLAEHLGLRSRAGFLAQVAAAGLRVVTTAGTAPRHPRVADRTDPFHAERSRETITLWRLSAEPG